MPPVTKEEITELLEALILGRLEILEQKLNQKLDTIMSAITDFHDQVTTTFTNIGNDITAIKAEIATLTSSIGQLTPGDAASLADVQTQATALQASADALVPPVAPPLPAGTSSAPSAAKVSSAATAAKK